MRGRTFFANRGFSRPWTSCRPTGFRRKVAQEMARVFSQVDLLLVPSLRDEMLTHHELHRASVAHIARGVCRSVGGAQRLGAGPRASAAEIFAAAAGAARRDADRAAVRRRHVGAGRVALERSFGVAGERPPVSEGAPGAGLSCTYNVPRGTFCAGKNICTSTYVQWPFCLTYSHAFRCGVVCKSLITLVAGCG